MSPRLKIAKVAALGCGRSVRVLLGDVFETGAFADLGQQIVGFELCRSHQSRIFRGICGSALLFAWTIRISLELDLFGPL